MGEADNFESDYDSTVAVPGSPGGVPGTAGTKYYQVLVPEFSFGSTTNIAVSGTDTSNTHTAPVAGAAVNSPYTSLSYGSSFLRMGSFPDLAGTLPAGFQESLDIANLVGDATRITALESHDTSPDASTRSNSYNGDPTYMLGFADDTRYRQEDSKVDATHPTSTNAWDTRRRAQTLNLLTRGGWWDHSGGNRISTTAGDKVDIIQGNYKMVVLGRQQLPKEYLSTVAPPTSFALVSSMTDTQQSKASDWYTAISASPVVQTTVDTAWTAVVAAFPTGTDAAALKAQLLYYMLAANSLITDISGGLMAENGPSPTHCIKSIEFDVNEDGGTWDVYQNNGVGNVFSSFYGDVGDVFFGPHKETWTGKAPDKDYDDTSDFYKKSLGMHPNPGALTDYPTIVDHVWAESIKSYKGSSNKKIPTISDTTYAETITAEVHANKVTSTTSAGNATVYSEINKDPTGDIISMTKAASITNLTAAGHIMDMSIALRTAIAVGLGRDIYLGGKFSFSFGVSNDYRFGPRCEVVSSAAVTFNLAEMDEITFNKKTIALQVLLGI